MAKALLESQRGASFSGRRSPRGRVNAFEDFQVGAGLANGADQGHEISHHGHGVPGADGYRVQNIAGVVIPGRRIEQGVGGGQPHGSLQGRTGAEQVQKPFDRLSGQGPQAAKYRAAAAEAVTKGVCQPASPVLEADAGIPQPPGGRRPPSGRAPFSGPLPRFVPAIPLRLFSSSMERKIQSRHLPPCLRRLFRHHPASPGQQARFVSRQIGRAGSTRPTCLTCLTIRQAGFLLLNQGLRRLLPRARIPLSTA